MMDFAIPIIASLFMIGYVLWHAVCEIAPLFSLIMGVVSRALRYWKEQQPTNKMESAERDKKKTPDQSSDEDLQGQHPTETTPVLSHVEEVQKQHPIATLEMTANNNNEDGLLDLLVGENGRMMDWEGDEDDDKLAIYDNFDLDDTFGTAAPVYPPPSSPAPISSSTPNHSRATQPDRSHSHPIPIPKSSNSPSTREEWLPSPSSPVSNRFDLLSIVTDAEEAQGSRTKEETRVDLGVAESTHSQEERDVEDREEAMMENEADAGASSEGTVETHVPEETPLMGCMSDGEQHEERGDDGEWQDVHRREKKRRQAESPPHGEVRPVMGRQPSAAIREVQIVESEEPLSRELITSIGTEMGVAYINTGSFVFLNEEAIKKFLLRSVPNQPRQSRKDNSKKSMWSTNGSRNPRATDNESRDAPIRSQLCHGVQSLFDSADQNGTSRSGNQSGQSSFPSAFAPVKGDSSQIRGSAGEKATSEFVFARTAAKQKAAEEEEEAKREEERKQGTMLAPSSPPISYLPPPGFESMVPPPMHEEQLSVREDARTESTPMDRQSMPMERREEELREQRVGRSESFEEGNNSRCSSYSADERSFAQREDSFVSAVASPLASISSQRGVFEEPYEGDRRALRGSRDLTSQSSMDHPAYSHDYATLRRGSNTQRRREEPRTPSPVASSRSRRSSSSTRSNREHFNRSQDYRTRHSSGNSNSTHSGQSARYTAVDSHRDRRSPSPQNSMMNHLYVDDRRRRSPTELNSRRGRDDIRPASQVDTRRRRRSSDREIPPRDLCKNQRGFSEDERDRHYSGSSNSQRGGRFIHDDRHSHTDAHSQHSRHQNSTVSHHDYRTRRVSGNTDSSSDRQSCLELEMYTTRRGSDTRSSSIVDQYPDKTSDNYRNPRESTCASSRPDREAEKTSDYGNIRVGSDTQSSSYAERSEEPAASSTHTPHPYNARAKSMYDRLVDDQICRARMRYHGGRPVYPALPIKYGTEIFESSPPAHPFGKSPFTIWENGVKYQMYYYSPELNRMYPVADETARDWLRGGFIHSTSLFATMRDGTLYPLRQLLAEKNRMQCFCGFADSIHEDEITLQIKLAEMERRIALMKELRDQ